MSIRRKAYDFHRLGAISPGIRGWKLFSSPVFHFDLSFRANRKKLSIARSQVRLASVLFVFSDLGGMASACVVSDGTHSGSVGTGPVALRGWPTRAADSWLFR